MRIQGDKPGLELRSRAKDQNPGGGNAAMRHNTHGRSVQSSLRSCLGIRLTSIISLSV